MRPSLTGRHNTALITRLHAEDQAHEVALQAFADLMGLRDTERELRERNEEIYLRAIRRYFEIEEQG